jgi:hypothetical protein
VRGYIILKEGKKLTKNIKLMYLSFKIKIEII